MLGYDLVHEIEVLPITTEDRDGMPWMHAVACPAALLVDAESGEERWAFLITIAPLVLTNGTGSPVNPIALF